MQLSASADYALRILHYIHVHKGLVRGPNISEAVGITYPHFQKIAQQLKQHELLEAEQGRNGGYRLTRPAQEISIYDVLSVIQGEMFITREAQINRNHSQQEVTNAIQTYFKGLQAMLINQMSCTSVADLHVPEAQVLRD